MKLTDRMLNSALPLVARHHLRMMEHETPTSGPEETKSVARSSARHFPPSGAESVELEPCHVKPREQPPHGRTGCQPWREYWPTHAGDAFHQKLQTSCPEVLSWRFDKTRLFEQPWRAWTNVPYTDAQEGPGRLRKQEQALYLEDVAATCENGRPIPSSVAKARAAIDHLVEHLGLPSVNPPDFYYLAPLALYRLERPFRCQLPSVPGYRMSNITAKKHDVKIFDLSGHEDLFTLDEAAFEFTKCPVKLPGWSDKAVTAEYLPQLGAWLQKHLSCEKVFFYAYNFRKCGLVENEATDWKPPFFRAHCDASDRTHIPRLQLYFPDTWSELMEHRIRLINVWKPLSTPIQDCPLAMCDFRTVDKEDLIAMDLVYPHMEDEAYEIFHNPSHRWFYKKGMQVDDAIVFKLHDTLSTVATVCPHSAFVDPTAPKGAPARASIEVKAIIIG